MTELSIQIINYNTKKYLERCLRSLLKDLEDVKFSYKIIILDNNSNDDLSGLQFSYKEVDFYRLKNNLGFAGGHNWLAVKQKSRKLLILNPDIEFSESNTVSRLVNQQKSSIEVVGPRLVNKEGITQQWDHGELKGLKAYIADKVNRSVWQEQTQLTRATWVSGAVFLINRTVFDELKGFDEGFFLYGEEEELCYRLRRKGGIVLYDPTISVLHHGGVAAPKDERRAHHERSKSYFSQKHAAKRLSYPFWRYLNKKLNAHHD